MQSPVVAQHIFVIGLDGARGPGVAMGQRLDGPVNIADTAAVILTVAGGPLPND